MVERRPGHEASIGGKGFSLPELLAVMALLGIAIAIGIPLVNEQVRIAEVRSVADDLALHLRAARMIAVTKRTTIEFFVYPDPRNEFEYDGRKISTPGRIRIAAGSDPIIRFKRNGSVDVLSTVILESDVSGALERWTASVNTMGFATLVHERVN